jgi:hypothetical protein
VPRDFLSPDLSQWEQLYSGSATLGSWDPMVVETWIEMLREMLKRISSLLRLGASVNTFLGAWTSGADPLECR